MFLQSASSLSKAYRISLATCLLSSDSNQFLSNHVTASAKRSHKDRCVNIPLARMNAAVSMASSTRLRSFSAFSSHCFLSSSKCSTDAWLLGFIRTMWAAFTTWGTRSAAYRHTAAHVINAVPLQNWNNYTVNLLTDKNIQSYYHKHARHANGISITPTINYPQLHRNDAEICQANR